MKDVKTNVMRILDKARINYQVFHYECQNFHDGLETVSALNLPAEQVFKTIVTTNKMPKAQYFVFVLPVNQELDLKLCAKLIGQKSLELINYHDLLAITGYLRGGCSPIGMKKQYQTFYDESIINLSEVYVSAGKIGQQIKIKPDDLITITGGKVGNFRCH